MNAAPRVGVFHPGTQHSPQTALAFQESGQLTWYATSVLYDPAKWPYRIERWLPSGIAERVGREFRRRQAPFLRPDLVRTFGIDEWLETAARRLGWPGLSQRFNARGNARFADGVIHLFKQHPVEAVWGYNSASLEVFRWAKRQGITCVLDQTIGHPRSLNRVLKEEFGRHPEFFFSDKPRTDDGWIAREDEEIALADVVVVGSDFSRRTMIENGCPAGKLRVVPYGYDETLFPATPPARPPMAGRPIECLFVGTIDPRKGVASLLKAFAKIVPEQARLTLVGSLGIPAQTFERYRAHVRHIPQVPHTEIVSHFRNADVFVFPSLFEGGGIVLYEAAGAGLGIIQSEACGTVVTPDCPSGIVLPAVSPEAVEAAIRYVVDDPARLEGWRRVSWEKRSRWSWDIYRRRVRTLLHHA